MHLRLSYHTLQRLLRLGLASMMLAGFVAELAEDVLEVDNVDAWLWFFSLSYERNLSTWYATCLLCLAAVLLSLIAVGTRQAHGPYVAHWWCLAAAFWSISLDEFVSFHEAMSLWFNFGGVLYFGWVIPAAGAVAVFGLCYIRFLAALPAVSRHGFVLAGAVYVTGALGMELPLGYWTDMAGSHNFVYALIDLVEEGLELLGTSLFLLALVRHLAGPSESIQLWLTTNPCDPQKLDLHEFP